MTNMVGKIKRIGAVFFLFLFTITQLAFPATQSSEYLCEIGMAFYRAGRYDNALNQFNKVLLIDPLNQTAKDYINLIFTHGLSVPSLEKVAPVKKIIRRIQQFPAREEIISQALSDIVREEELRKEAARSKERAGIKITGNLQTSLGITPKDVIWNQAESNLNEEDWHSLSEDAYNRRANTFDARIYDRLKLNLDTQEKAGFSFHGSMSIDPWSVTGKSDKITVVGTNPLDPLITDTAEFELYYWGNSQYTVAHDALTKLRGDGVRLGETKVVHGKVD